MEGEREELSMEGLANHDDGDPCVGARCSAPRWLGISASRWAGMTGDGEGPAGGVGGAWWWPGFRGGGRVAVVSRWRGWWRWWPGRCWRGRGFPWRGGGGRGLGGRRGWPRCAGSGPLRGG